MKKPSDSSWEAEREKIIGLGERSLRKTYYPELQQKLDELERFRSLLDESNDCIFLIQAASLTFVDVNESACRQLFAKRDEFLDQPLARFLPEETVARIADLVVTGPSQGWDRDTITTYLQKGGGERLPVEITIRVVSFNRNLYGVAVARDITERQRAEAALLENSRMRRDMELARQIQLSLLPTGPPELAGVLLAGCCVPATDVGGDYYDYYRRADDVVDLVVADVSGHSIGAALMTAEARSVLRAEVHSFASTGAILAALNEILYEDLNQAGLFITIFYVKYDISSRTLTYSNAGHVPPILSRPSEAACRELDAEGLILGVKEEVAFEEKQFQLEVDDLLLLYTDGITEAQDPDGEMFGRSRLCEILHASQGESPQAIIDIVLREVAAFTGTTTLEDDATMVVLKVL
jgi:sigma-B regulation protein RsbU (phosphoserine phosphatase)